MVQLQPMWEEIFIRPEFWNAEKNAVKTVYS